MYVLYCIPNPLIKSHRANANLPWEINLETILNLRNLRLIKCEQNIIDYQWVAITKLDESSTNNFVLPSS